MLSMLTLFATLSAPAEAAPTAYTLVPDQGRLFVVVRYDRSSLLARMGHDHVVVGEHYTGTVVWDTDDVRACDVRIDLPVTALSVDPGDARDWIGLDGETSDGDKDTITRNFSGEGQLWADRFPAITFRSARCEPTDDGFVAVTGDLAIRGVAKRLTVPMRVTTGSGALEARGGFTLRHSDFGMSPFSAAVGALRNDERLEFVVDVRGVPR